MPNDLLNQLIRNGATMPPHEQERIGAAAVFLLSVIASSEDTSNAKQEVQSLLAASHRPMYFKSDTGLFYFILAMPVKDYGTLSVIEKPLRKIRSAIDEVRAEYPNINIGLTGKPVLQADEMATSNEDMTKASILAFALCAILFILMIGGVLRPILAMIAFLIGSAWTYGAVTLIIGQLNLLSIVFMLVLVGVALDYGVHILSRYKEQRRAQNARDSIANAMRTVGRGNMTGALTSSTVFFMAVLTTFQGLRELGMVAGIGLLLCLIAIMLVLPALLAVVDRRCNDGIEIATGEKRQAMSEAPGFLGIMITRPGIVLIVAAVISGTLIIAPGRLRFEGNLLELQATGLESVEWEHRILSDSSSASWFGAIAVDTQQQALEIIEKSRQYSTIGAVHSVFDVILPQTMERDAMRRQLHEPLAANSMTAASRPAETHELWSIEDLRQAVASLDLIAAGAAQQAPDESARLGRLSADLKGLITALESEEKASERGAARPTRDRIDWQVHEFGTSLRTILEGDRLPLRDALPEALRRQYISPQPHGRYLVAMHPKKNVWKYEPMREFIQDMREVDPNVTGVPITHFESLGEMLWSFLIMSILALIAIVIIVWLDFRRLRDVALAVLPLLLSLAWTVELMGVFGISFNLANFFAVPMLIGLGVDAGVHVLHRYHEGGPTRFSLGGTRRAVILTGLTTIIGFGCLLIAHHRGLQSLGMVMTIGSTCSLMASIIILPALLAWLERQSSRRQIPCTSKETT